MRKFLIIALLFLSLPAYAQEERTAGIRSVHKDTAIFSDFAGRPYILRLPSSAAQGKTPLLIALHGGGGNMNHLRRNLGMDETADKHGFMVAYLSGNPGERFIARNLRTWNGGGGCCGNAYRQNIDDVSYIESFIREMIRAHNADPARIYITGHSNGGIMAYRFACERSGVTTAIVPISGTLMVEKCTAPGLRVLHIHGDHDEHLLVEGGYGPRSVAKLNFTSVAETERRLKAAGADMSIKIVKNGPHALSGLDEILQDTESRSLAETIMRFIDR